MDNPTSSPSSCHIHVIGVVVGIGDVDVGNIVVVVIVVVVVIIIVVVDVVGIVDCSVDKSHGKTHESK